VIILDLTAAGGVLRYDAVTVSSPGERDRVRA